MSVYWYLSILTNNENTARIVELNSSNQRRNQRETAHPFKRYDIVKGIYIYISIGTVCVRIKCKLITIWVDFNKKYDLLSAWVKPIKVIVIRKWWKQSRFGLFILFTNYAKSVCMPRYTVDNGFNICSFWLMDGSVLKILNSTINCPWSNRSDSLSWCSSVYLIDSGLSVVVSWLLFSLIILARSFIYFVITLFTFHLLVHNTYHSRCLERPHAILLIAITFVEDMSQDLTSKAKLISLVNQSSCWVDDGVPYNRVINFSVDWWIYLISTVWTNTVNLLIPLRNLVRGINFIEIIKEIKL